MDSLSPCTIMFLMTKHSKVDSLRTFIRSILILRSTMLGQGTLGHETLGHETLGHETLGHVAGSRYFEAHDFGARDFGARKLVIKLHKGSFNLTYHS